MRSASLASAPNQPLRHIPATETTNHWQAKRLPNRHQAIWRANHDKPLIFKVNPPPPPGLHPGSAASASTICNQYLMDPLPVPPPSAASTPVIRNLHLPIRSESLRDQRRASHPPSRATYPTLSVCLPVPDRQHPTSGASASPTLSVCFSISDRQPPPPATSISGICNECLPDSHLPPTATLLESRLLADQGWQGWRWSS